LERLNALTPQRGIWNYYWAIQRAIRNQRSSGIGIGNHPESASDPETESATSDPDEMNPVHNIEKG
jgi:hypothetical protein